MIEAGSVQSPTDQLNITLIDTPSIAVANYNNQYNNLYVQPLLVAYVAYSQGTGKFSQFGWEPLPKNVPVIHGKPSILIPKVHFCRFWFHLESERDIEP